MAESDDALADEANLEIELAEAKEDYRNNLGDNTAKIRLRDAKKALIEARQTRRGEGVTIGGDAVQES